MRKRMLPCVLALTAALASGRALALEGTVSFGGSCADRLYEAVACGDGILAVGSTTSTDGDLSDRSREGKAGWAARISADGRLLWSVCTAHAGRDEMSAPYAHADGTFSAVLSGERSGSEWLRISDRGRVLTRVAVSGHNSGPVSDSRPESGSYDSRSHRGGNCTAWRPFRRDSRECRPPERSCCPRRSPPEVLWIPPSNALPSQCRRHCSPEPD